MAETRADRKSKVMSDVDLAISSGKGLDEVLRTALEGLVTALDGAEEDKVFAQNLAIHCATAGRKADRNGSAEGLEESEKDEFLSVVAHALKSPLTALKGYTQLHLRKVAKQPDLKDDLRSLEAIESQANRILNVVNRLVDLGRIQVGNLELHCEPVDIVRLVSAAVEQARINAYRHELVMETDSDRVEGSWDRRAIEQVIASLIDNAIRYNPQGGRIEVRVSSCSGEATVSIRDYGNGIAQDEQELLFTKYFRSKTAVSQKISGLGLSLYVDKNIVEAHGGRIWARSEPGGGSEFSFSLPINALQ